VSPRRTDDDRNARGSGALRALHYQRHDARKLKALRMQLKVGVDALERGDFIKIDDADPEDYLASLVGHR
jgi:antitoxin ParD1/3/4